MAVIKKPAPGEQPLCTECVKHVHEQGWGTPNCVPIGWPGTLCAYHIGLIDSERYVAETERLIERKIRFRS